MADTALVDYDFYTNTYMGEPVTAEDFPRYEARAEDAILIVINKTVDEAALLPEAVLLAVKKAICAQIDYLFEYGLGVSVYGKEAGGGFTVGKVSVNNGSATGTASGARSMITPAAYAYLERTGLLNPQVDTGAEPWPATRGWL
jgi:hypothetical protein